METVQIHRPTPRALLKLRKGEKIRIKPDLMGNGLTLQLPAHRVASLGKYFAKGKGCCFQMDEHELNHNMGCGFLKDVKKFGKTINKKVLAPAKKGLVSFGKQALPVLKDIGKEVTAVAAKYGPQVATAALTAIGTATGQPEIIAAAPMVGAVLGKVAAKYGKKAIDKQIDSIGTKKQSKAITGAVNAVKKIVAPKNPFAGLSFGSKTPVATAEAPAEAEAEAMPEKQQFKVQKRRRPIGKPKPVLAEAEMAEPVMAEATYEQPPAQVLSPYADAVPLSTGQGLYAQVQGRGMRMRQMKMNMLHKQPMIEKSSVGLHGRFIAGAGVQALQSQPQFQNFMWQSTLGPMKGHGLYAGNGLY